MFIPYSYFPFQNLRYSCTIQLPFCHDHSYPKNSFTLTLPTPRLKKANVVINELYFNPPPNGSDFLELYNPSRDYISTTQLMLTNGRDSLHLKNCLPHMTIAPGEYIVLTNDTSFILERFTKSSNIRFLQVKDLVKMPDDSGTIYLVSASHQLIDVVHYNESYHSIYLHDAEDITLERIHPLFSGTKANNWASASAQDHYGTPGQKNSQLISNYPKTKIIPSVLSPNGDGAADVLHVHLTFPETGCLCSAAIFDINGVCHSILQRAELMPVNHVITWYGTNFKGDLVGPGGYFVYLECYSPTGMKSIQKLPFYVDN